MEPGTGRRRIQDVSSHAIALVALFVALGSGAFAAVVGVNSVGSAQIKPNAVGPSELASDAVGTDALQAAAVKTQQLKAQAITQDKMAANSVGEAQIKANSILQQMLQANSVGEQQMKAQSVGEAQLKAQAITQEKIAAASVGQQQLQANAVGLAQLAPEATSTLYTNNYDSNTPVTITTDTLIGSLSLPAGSYLVSAGVEAVHTNTVNPTRLECYILNGATTVDFGKERLQPNNGAGALIFTKQMLQGPATLASDGAIQFRCTTTGPATSIDLTPIHFQALRVASIVAQ